VGFALLSLSLLCSGLTRVYCGLHHALGPGHESSLVAGSSFSSSGFASSGKSGASGGTSVAGEVETVESRGKTLARVSAVS
jgi:hypothetical protein